MVAVFEADSLLERSREGEAGGARGGGESLFVQLLQRRKAGSRERT